MSKMHGLYRGSVDQWERLILDEYGQDPLDIFEMECCWYGTCELDDPIDSYIRDMGYHREDNDSLKMLIDMYRGGSFNDMTLTEYLMKILCNDMPERLSKLRISAPLFVGVE